VGQINFPAYDAVKEAANQKISVSDITGSLLLAARDLKIYYNSINSKPWSKNELSYNKLKTIENKHIPLHPTETLEGRTLYSLVKG